MFGSLGGPEIIFIFVLALLLFGPRKLPEIGRTVGRTLSELRKATHDFRSTLEREIDIEQVKDARNEIESAAASVRQAADDVTRVPRRPPESPAGGPQSDRAVGSSGEPGGTEPTS